MRKESLIKNKIFTFYFFLTIFITCLPRDTCFDLRIAPSAHQAYPRRRFPRRPPPVLPRERQNLSKKELFLAPVVITGSLIFWAHITKRIASFCYNRLKKNPPNPTDWAKKYIKEDDGNHPLKAPLIPTRPLKKVN